MRGNGFTTAPLAIDGDGLCCCDRDDTIVRARDRDAVASNEETETATAPLLGSCGFILSLYILVVSSSSPLTVWLLWVISVLGFTIVEKRNTVGFSEYVDGEEETQVRLPHRMLLPRDDVEL
ncbi:hypothetical protein PIB30_041287 [Stylosanthes scabra]|uniref:Uncharacterized protein n=1 Tax=Stylosanthes scabra TaxID=79078 RepID=A0ABU6YDI1_9FABA|nr:hypothetical protein [Stylosanthes scabra]